MWPQENKLPGEGPRKLVDCPRHTILHPDDAAEIDKAVDWLRRTPAGVPIVYLVFFHWPCNFNMTGELRQTSTLDQEELQIYRDQARLVLRQHRATNFLFYFDEASKEEQAAIRMAKKKNATLRAVFRDGKETGLASAQQKVQKLQEEAKQARLKDTNQQSEIANLKNEIEAQRTTIAKLKDEKEAQRTNIANLEERVGQLESEARESSEQHSNEITQ